MSTKEADGSKPDEYECPDCEHVSSSWRGLCIHHSKSHENELEKPTITCVQCGKVEERWPGEIEKADIHYCSKDCRGKHENNHRTVQCDYCGDDVEKRGGQFEKYDHHFCDIRCSSDWTAENFEQVSGPDNPKYTRVELVCERKGCEETRELRPSERDNRRFCSKSCAYEHRVGENNPLWKENTVHGYGRGWNEEKREAVRERDGCKCQFCGKTQSEELETAGRKLSVHHVTPARMFDDAQKRNGMSNLLAVCQSCHTKWEQIAPLRPVFDND